MISRACGKLGKVWSITLCLLAVNLIFANSLDPDQAQKNVGSVLDSNCLTVSHSDSVANNFMKKKIIFQKVRSQKIMKNYPA